MKIKILFLVGLTVSLLAAQAGPVDDVTGAVQKLGNEANYSWHTTVDFPAATPSSPGPIDGKVEKGSLTYIKRSPIQNPPADSQFSNLTLEILMHGKTILVADPDPDGGWETLADFSSSDLSGPGPFVGDMIRQFKTPAVQAAELVNDSANLAQKEDSYAGDLTPDAAKRFLAAPDNATVSNVSGTVQFWIKDGELTKYEYKVEGAVASGDKTEQIKRDTVVEIQNVGTTTIHVPASAKKLLP